MRRKNFIAAAFFTFVLTSGAAAQNLKNDLTLLMRWFEGRFDNYAQTIEEKESKAEFPHERIHSIFHRAHLPNIGENVFYVQQYLDGDETKVYRQRLYVFAPNEAERAIELRIYTFDDEKKYRDAHLDASKLKDLTAANLKATPGCEVFWRLNKTGDKFEGSMKPNACKIFSQRLKKNIIITDDLFLTAEEIWINDQARDEQGNYVFGNKANVHHKLKRARIFAGWTAVLKDGSTESRGADAPAEAWDGQRDLRIHDQGGRVKINEKFSAELAQLSHKNGARVLKLGIVETASGKTVAYTWANPEAERIGINLRWIQAGFTLKK
jgi:hypothetical protein